MFKIAIIVPTYIRSDFPEGVKENNGLKILKRALESLKELKKEGMVYIILPFCIEGEGINKGLDAEYHSTLMKELSDTFPFSRIILTTYNFKDLKEYISKKGFSDIAERLMICGFPNIRNCGLILSQALGADVAIFLDNDEVINTPDFLNIALEGLFSSVNGWQMDGKGGFYISGSGELYERISQQWWQIFWKKGRLFEKVWKAMVEDKNRFVKSSIILGGNMAITRRLFEHVPFDPSISRGEDIDYMINARMAGFNILFDKQLKITHLHEERNMSYTKSELKLDIERFLYERQKVAGNKNLALDPYPGYFLKWDIKIKSVITVILFSLYLTFNRGWKEALEVYTYLNPLFRTTKDKESYERFKERWPHFMEFIRFDGLKEVIREGTL